MSFNRRRLPTPPPLPDLSDVERYHAGCLAPPNGGPETPDYLTRPPPPPEHDPLGRAIATALDLTIGPSAGPIDWSIP